MRIPLRFPGIAIRVTFQTLLASYYSGKIED
jgi:hypothetical protein